MTMKQSRGFSPGTDTALLKALIGTMRYALADPPLSPTLTQISPRKTNGLRTVLRNPIVSPEYEAAISPSPTLLLNSLDHRPWSSLAESTSYLSGVAAITPVPMPGMSCHAQCRE